MTPERYNRVVEAFLNASERSPSTRAEFVTTVCIGDDELRREVEAMLDADEQCGDFLEKPPNNVAADMVGGRAGSIVGQRLGEYEVVELLATGGMGEVFLARDTQLGRSAALKILPEEYTVDPARLRRFEREAHAIAALNHPNIVTIYGVGKAGSLSFLATEFIEGQTLRALIDAGPLPTEIVVSMAVQAASALSAAHAGGIMHRDIKPENVVWRSDGLLKILDFGLAKRSEQAPISTHAVRGLPEVPPTPVGLIVGTPRYMSPEQARGVPIDARTDIFSLGCVLYELLAGQPAAPGAKLTDVLSAILHG